MATLKFEGLEKTISAMERVADQKRVDSAIRRAIYPTAGLAIDSIKAAEESVSVGLFDIDAKINAKRRTSKTLRRRLVTGTMLDDKMRRTNEGTIYIDVIWKGRTRSGYISNLIKAIESGGTWGGRRTRIPKTGIIRRTMKQMAPKMNELMAENLSEELGKIMEE